MAERHFPQQSALLLYHGKFGTIVRDSLAGWSRSNSVAAQAACWPGAVGRLLVNCFADGAGRWGRANAGIKSSHLPPGAPRSWSSFFLSLSLSFHFTDCPHKSSQFQLQTLSHYANEFPHRKAPHARCPSIQQGPHFEYAGIFSSPSPQLLFSIFVKRMSYF